MLKKEKRKSYFVCLNNPFVTPIVYNCVCNSYHFDIFNDFFNLLGKNTKKHGGKVLSKIQP